MTRFIISVALSLLCGLISLSLAAQSSAPIITDCPSSPADQVADEMCQGEIPDLTTMVTATDASGNAITNITQAPPAGSAVGIGTHIITLKATDNAGNTAVCIVQQRVTAYDGNIPPGGALLAGTVPGSGGDFFAGGAYTINADGTDYTYFENPLGDTHFGSLVELNGELYGMTMMDEGSESGPNFIGGIIYKISPTGEYTLLHQFNQAQGGFALGGIALPNSSLLEHGGELYGCAPYGGPNNAGVIFKITPQGSYSELHAFDTATGASPFGSMTLLDGMLYGMTFTGGDHGRGVIFKMNIDGSSYSVLHHFDGDNGANPNGALTIFNGDLYGMSTAVRTIDDQTTSTHLIFNITTAGQYTIFHEFPEVIQGIPIGNLVPFGSELFGMVTMFGVNEGFIFKMTADANVTRLHTFSGGVDGGITFGNDLIVFGDRILGTTSEGGINDGGVMFEIDRAGTYTKLRDFDSLKVNAFPLGGLTAITPCHRPELESVDAIKLCDNPTFDLTSVTLTDRNPTTAPISGTISYHTVSDPASATDDLIVDPTAVGVGTYYIRKEVGCCADIMSITLIAPGLEITACPDALTITLDEQCQAQMPDLTNQVTVQTCSDIPVITQSIVPGSSLATGLTEVIITVDADGDSQTCTVNVNVSVNPVPTFTGCESTDTLIFIGETGCHVTMPDITGLIVTTGCSDYTLSQEPPAGEEFSAIDGSTIGAFLIVTDDVSGIEERCFMTFTVRDTTPPSITTDCANLSVEDLIMTENCEVRIPDLTIRVEHQDNCNTTVTQSPAPDSIMHATHDQQIPVTITITDTGGNTDECTITLTAKDTSAPVITNDCSTLDQDIILEEDCSVTIPNLTSELTVESDCSLAIVTQDPAPDSIMSLVHDQQVIVTLTTTNGSGKTDQCTITLTAKDTIAPVILTDCGTLDQDIILGEDCMVAIPDLTTNLDITENCSQPVVVTQSPAAESMINAFHNEGITVTITSTDSQGNTNVCTTMLTAKDTTAPVITNNCSALDQDIILEEDCSVTIPDLTIEPTIASDCSEAIVTQNPAPDSIMSLVHDQQVAVTLTTTNASGKTDQCIITLTAKDTSAPVITNDCSTLDQVIILEEDCSVTIPDLTIEPTIASDCSPGIVIQDPAPDSIMSLEHDQQVTVTLTTTNGSGKTDQCIIILTAKDTSAPVITNDCHALDQDIILEEDCSVTIPDLTIEPTIASGCSPVIVTQDPAPDSIMSLIHDQQVTVTLTITNGSGKTDQCTITLTAEDISAPVITNDCSTLDQDMILTEDCSVTIPDFTNDIAVVSDCSAAIVTQDPAPDSIMSLIHDQQVTVTLTTTNGSGKTDQCTITLTAKDTIAPVILTDCGTLDQNVILGQDCMVAIPDLTNDPMVASDCSPAIVTQDPAPNSIMSLVHDQQVSVTLTAINGSGKTDQCTITLTAKDTSAPVIVSNCSMLDRNIILGEECLITIPNFTTSIFVNSDCSEAIVTQDPALDSIMSLVHDQQVAVTLTTTNASGKTDQCIITLTAKDTSAPVITNDCSTLDQVIILEEDCSVTIPDLTNELTVESDCSPAIITQDPAPDSIMSLEHDQQVSVTLTAINGSGKTDQCIVTLTTTVIDCSAPDRDISIDANCSVTIPDLTNEVVKSSSCGVAFTVSQNPAADSVISVDIDELIPVTFTISDNQGNTTHQCLITLTAKDVTPPSVDNCAPIVFLYMSGKPFCAVSVDELVSNLNWSDCDDELTITHTDFSFPFEHGDQDLLRVTATDRSGNSTTCTRTVIIQDTIAPIITSDCSTLHQDLLIDENCEITIPNIPFGSEDNCNHSRNQSPAPGTKISAANGDQISVTISVTDDAGLSDQCIIILTAESTSITTDCSAIDASAVLDENCEIEIPDLTSEIMVAQNCTAASEVTISQLPAPGTLVSANPFDEIPVTLIVTDQLNNTDECIISVNVIDQSGPVAVNCEPFTADLMLEEDGDVTVPDLLSTIEWMDCDQFIGVFSNADENDGPFSAKRFQHGDQIPVRIQAFDGSFNGGHCNIAVYNVVDMTPPVITTSCETLDQELNMTNDCEIIIPDLVSSVTATDFSPITITQSPAADSVMATTHGENVIVTITATDIAGNTDQCIVTLTTRAPEVTLTGEITGVAEVCPGIQAYLYSIPADEDVASYQWSYTGPGARLSAHANTVLVSYSDQTAIGGDLMVQTVSHCGRVSTDTLSLTISISDDPDCLVGKCNLDQIVVDADYLEFSGRTDFGAINLIQVSTQLSGDQTFIFTSGDEIELLPGFEVEQGTSMIATIEVCIFQKG